MRRLKLPSDSAIWEGPYSAVEHATGLRVSHAFLVEQIPSLNAKSVCGRWQARIVDKPYPNFRRWGDGPAGMYADQRWCEDCRVKVPPIRARMDAEALRAFANKRAGKGKTTRPKPPKADESFEKRHPTQAQLWVRAIAFPTLGPDAVAFDANIDVEWRCTAYGHPTFIDQPKHVHQLVDAKRKVCPLCSVGLRAEPWTRPRILAFVRSMEHHLEQLSPADRYQLLLQTGLLNSGGAWAAPIAEAMLHASGRATHADLVDLVEGFEPEAKALALFKRLKRCTTWPSEEAEKASTSGDVRERYAHWCDVVEHSYKLEAIRRTCGPSRQRQLATLWRYAPALASAQPDDLRQVLLNLFPGRGLRLEHIVAEPPEEELQRVNSFLWTLSAFALSRNTERDAEIVAARDEIASEQQQRSQWFEARNYRIGDAEGRPPYKPATTAKLISTLLAPARRDATINDLRQMLGDDESDETTAREMWRVVPVVGDADDVRKLMREAFPDIAFDQEVTSPAKPAAESLAAWKEQVFSEVGEAAVEDRDRAPVTPESDDLPSDKVGQVLDVSDRLLFADYDLEAIDYFLASQVAKLWAVAFDAPNEALAAATRWSGSDFGNQVRDAFLHELLAVEQLCLPDDWDFRPPGVPATAKPFAPRVMQRLTAVRLQHSARGVGNWSLMGGGKTVSAVLSAAVLDAKLTVVICPNATVAGWHDEILRVFPSAAVSLDWSPPAGAARRFVLLNVEQFQLSDTEARIRNLLDLEVPAFVVLDEVHKFKQRDKALSRRSEMMLAFLSTAAERFPNLKVLGLSGTPVINNLMEARSLIELCTLTRHSDLDVAPTLPNAMRVHSRLARLGLRYRPDYLRAFDGIRKVPIDVSPRLDELRRANDHHAAESILMEEKREAIALHASQRTVVYSELVAGVHEQIAARLVRKGLRVGYFNGTDKSGLAKFKTGEIDVLIASNALGTGVDGLQHCTDRLIVATLPWTSSDFDQLLGRFFRPKSDGSVGHAEVVVPWTFLPAIASRTGHEWSMDEARWRRIQYKSSLADTAVDGVLPEGELRSPEQAFKDLQSWLVRLESAPIEHPKREPLRVPLGEPERRAVTARVADLTRFHARVASSLSQTTHALLQTAPEQWAWYHTEVEDAASTWPFKPVDRCIEWLRRRAERRRGLVVADLGCGLAKVHAALHSVCDVKSFDHIAINEHVAATNIAVGIPLPDSSVDAVVLSLVLDWQKDWEHCLDEATRILGLDGQLLLWETRSFMERIGGLSQLDGLLARRGLKVLERFDEHFVGVVAIKT